MSDDLERSGSVEWHALPVERITERLSTDTARGLAPDVAAQRLAEQGRNELAATAGTPLSKHIAHQLADPLVYLLVGAAVVSFLVGERFDAAVITIIVVANVVIGVIQEFRAEKAIEALRDLTAPRARVMRDADVDDVDAAELVVGDVILLETGDRVPADARLFEESEILVDESALTGESEAIDKDPAPAESGTALADRRSMLYMSTPVVGGRGRAVVVATGMDTMLGGIAGQVRSAERQPTPLQVRLARLSTRLGVLSVVAAVAIFGLGMIRGGDLAEMLLFSVAAAVSAIPEGLPAAVSVSLALGVQRMARRNAIVRRLAAVETLGSCTVICTDKTGTLTRNEMTATHAWTPFTVHDFSQERADDTGSEDADATGLLRQLLLAGCRANNARFEHHDDGSPYSVGNPTEAALLAVALHHAVIAPDTDCAAGRMGEIPFSSKTKHMATLDRLGSEDLPKGVEPGGPEQLTLTVKGAFDVVLGFCDRVATGDGVVPLSDEIKDRIEEAAAGYTDQALRVIAAALKVYNGSAHDLEPSDAQDGLVFLGMWGLLDPPRVEARDSVQAAKRAGIVVKMITGDHKTTATSIARAVGIIDDRHADTLTGREIDELTDDELRRRVDTVNVYARVEPRHKIRIVEALQSRSEVVSMTGDGVNDAPALKRADIGVAMGITGTEVSKEAADMVLADDDFATIVGAVEEGRVLFGNLRRVVAFLVMVALGQVTAIMANQLLGLPLPITAVMVLWANLVVASTCTVPLGIEPKHDDVLTDPPRPKDEDIIDRESLVRIIAGSALKASGMLGVFLWTWNGQGLAYAQVVTFMTLVAFEWFQAVGNRSWRKSVLEIGLFSNPSLFVGIGIGAVLQWIAVSSPLTERVLGTTPIGIAEWGLALAVGSSGLVLSEALTLAYRRKSRRTARA